MMNWAPRYVLLWGLLTVAVSALAEGAKPSARIDYAGQVLMDSSNAQRIEASGDAHAQGLLAEARELYRQARAAQAAGGFEQAEKLGGEALRRFSLAAQALPKASASDQELRNRYGELSHELSRYIDWYDSAPYISRDDHLALDEIKASMANAQELAKYGKYQDANSVLNSALAEVVAISNRNLTSDTVISSLEFATPQEEYRFELARNNDYQRLIPLAIEQKQPNPARLSMMRRYETEAEQLKQQAEAEFEQGQLEEAVSKLQASTEQLVRALGILGVR